MRLVESIDHKRIGIWSVHLSLATDSVLVVLLGLRTVSSKFPVAAPNSSVIVQIFGLKSSRATRAAERFFKERRVGIQFVDLKQKPMAPGEIKRFVERFGLTALIDTEGKAYVDAGLKYLRISDSELLERIERDPRLLRLPLIRAANRLSIGEDQDSWKEMLAAPHESRR